MIGLNAIPGEGKAAAEVEHYALVAAKDGLYPVMERGSKDAVGYIELAAGDVWKYGTTKNPETRYSETFLNSTGQGLMYQTISSGTKAEALAAEKASILNYITESGALPPGNKIIR